LNIPLHHRAVVSSVLAPGGRVASFANFAVLKVSSSAVAAVEDFTIPWQGTLTWYYQPSRLDQDFFKRCYSSFTPHFVLACDRQSLASQHWVQVGGVSIVNDVQIFQISMTQVHYPSCRKSPLPFGKI
jgi:hypothetical protein